MPEPPKSAVKSFEHFYKNLKEKTLLVLTLKMTWVCFTTAVGIYLNYDQIREKALTVPPIQQRFCSWRVLNADTSEWPPEKIAEELNKAIQMAKEEKWEDSLTYLDKLTRRNLATPGIFTIKSGVLLEKRQPGDAKAELRKEFDLLDCLDALPDDQLKLRKPYKSPGQNDYEADVIRTLLKRSRALAHYNFACYFASTADSDKALDHLQKAVDLGYGNADQLGRDSYFQSIRQTVRFQQILARISN